MRLPLVSQARAPGRPGSEGRAVSGHPPAGAGRAPRFLAPLVFGLLLVAFAAGIWGNYRAAFPGRGLYRVTGVFEARWGETMMLVRHEAIPGLMDEMAAMSLVTESRALLDQAALERGDRVRLTIRQTPEALLVVEIQKLP